MAEAQNPFLLPPGSTPSGPLPHAAPPPEPAPRPDAAAPRDPDHYIAIPASVESATHRLGRPERSTTEPAEAVAEETLLANPSATPADAIWAVLLPDGTRIELIGPTLLGRDPAASPEHPGARLLPLADPGKTMSKTHALLEPAPAFGAILVHDLYSTNGVAVDAGGVRTIVLPGSSAPARVGSSVFLGSFLIQVAVGAPDRA